MGCPVGQSGRPRSTSWPAPSGPPASFPTAVQPDPWSAGSWPRSSRLPPRRGPARPGCREELVGIAAVNAVVRRPDAAPPTGEVLVHGLHTHLPLESALTTRFQMPMPGIPKFTRSELFEATPDGGQTLFTVRVLRPSSAKDRAKLEEIGPMLGHAYGDGLAALAPMIRADVAARSAAAATAAPEPEVPVSAGRNLLAQS